MKRAIFLLTLAPWLTAAEPVRTMEGVITDTMCGKTHTMMPGKPDDQCIAMCVRGSSSEYALNEDGTIWKLSDQKQAAKFSAAKVRVTGAVNEKAKTIKVQEIEREP